MEIRPPYKQHYPAIADLLSRSLGEPWDLQAVADRVFYDPDYDPNHAWMAREKGEVLGFLHCVLRSGRAWVKMIAVDPVRQRQGLGKEMLERAEERLAGEGAAEMRVEGTPAYEFYPGVPRRFEAALRFFERQGYQAGLESHLSWVAPAVAPLGAEPDAARVKRWIQERAPEAWEQVEERLSRRPAALAFREGEGLCLAEPGRSLGPLWLEREGEAGALVAQALALASSEPPLDARGLRLHDARPREWWSRSLTLGQSEGAASYLKRL